MNRDQNENANTRCHYGSGYSRLLLFKKPMGFEWITDGIQFHRSESRVHRLHHRADDNAEGAREDEAHVLDENHGGDVRHIRRTVHSQVQRVPIHNHRTECRLALRCKGEFG